MVALKNKNRLSPVYDTPFASDSRAQLSRRPPTRLPPREPFAFVQPGVISFDLLHWDESRA